MDKSSTQIIFIDGSQEALHPLYEALAAQGYQVKLFHNIEESLLHLSRTDVLVLEPSIATQPGSSKLINAPMILVLQQSGQEQLPPWLNARHIHLLPFPKHAEELLNRIVQYTAPPEPDFGIDPTNSEQLALLFSITQSLSGHLDIEELFHSILDLAPRLGGEFAALLIQEGDDTLYYRSTQPGREELTGPAGRRFAQRLLKEGLEGWVLRHNQSALLPNTLQDSRWFRASYLPEAAHCVLAASIRLDRVEAKGVYMVGSEQPGHFTRQDIPLFEAAITQISLAIENALLFKNQSERSVQLSLINEVGQTATSILNLDAMLRTVVQAIRRSFAFYSVAIHLYNPTTQLVELRARTGLEPTGSPAELPRTSHRLRQGLIGWAAATTKTILANDVAQDPRYLFNNDNPEIRSQLCVPITLGVKTIGVLDLQSARLEAFDRHHVSALETLADQLAIAIENARLYDEINRYIQRLKSLIEIGQAVTSTLDLAETLTLITDHTNRLMKTAAASVVLQDAETNDIHFAAASGEGAEAVIGLRMEPGQGLAGWVAEKGQPVIVPDVAEDPRFYAAVDEQSGFTTRSILAVPLQTKGQTIGAIEVMNKEQGTFTREDLTLLEALATSAATAIENAQLYEEKIQTIKRLAETQDQLVQSGKLAAVGELAAGVAHEINNPLTTIIGLTGLLLDTNAPSEDPTERLEDLQMIYDEARRAKHIVHSLLDFARVSPPVRQPANLNQVIEEAILLVYTKNVSRKIELRKKLNPLPDMRLDVNQIKQVIVNLLNNAVQAMEDNRERPAILSVTSQWLTEPDRVICSIGDTGRGIQPDHLDKVFDPFFTTKEVGQGTGLGLSISYGIIEKHVGNISVESTPGQGSEFTLTLPVKEPPDYG